MYYKIPTINGFMPTVDYKQSMDIVQISPGLNAVRLHNSSIAPQVGWLELSPEEIAEYFPTKEEDPAGLSLEEKVDIIFKAMLDSGTIVKEALPAEQQAKIDAEIVKEVN